MAMSTPAPITTVSYVVRTRIHGYNGMGWEGETHKESSFWNEPAARKRMADIRALRQAATCTNCTEDEAALEQERELEDQLTDGRSFCFKGEPVLIKRTVTEEVVP